MHSVSKRSGDWWTQMIFWPEWLNMNGIFLDMILRRKTEQSLLGLVHNIHFLKWETTELSRDRARPPGNQSCQTFSFDKITKTAGNHLLLCQQTPLLFYLELKTLKTLFGFEYFFKTILWAFYSLSSLMLLWLLWWVIIMVTVTLYRSD